MLSHVILNKFLVASVEQIQDNNVIVVRMKVVIVSDTHYYYPDLYPGELLIHCGDGTFEGNRREVFALLSWLGKQPFRHKSFVPGNHDLLFQKADDVWLNSLVKEAGITVLIDNETIIDGIKIYGSPWVPSNSQFAFVGPDKLLKQKWDNIPKDVEILVTHGPPHTVLDQNASGKHCGSRSLLAAIAKLKPTYHFFGHIHESYGSYHNGDTKFVNAALSDKSYNLRNTPVVLEI